MTLSQAYLLANDSEFRVLAGFTSPPRAATVTALEPSGQVRLALDDADGADVLAWPLNGFVYHVGDVVYVLFAANSPESAIVLGAKAPLPRLDAAVLAQGDAALHLHNGVGGLIFVTKTGIDATAQTILPNGSGDITKAFAFLIAISDGSIGSAAMNFLLPGGNQDFSVGSLTIRLACAADGSLTVKRQSGTGTATVALLGVWQ